MGDKIPNLSGSPGQASASEKQPPAKAANQPSTSARSSSSCSTQSDNALSKGNMNNNNNQPPRPTPVGNFTTGFWSVPFPQGRRTPAQPAHTGAASQHGFQLPPAVAPSGLIPAATWPSYNALVGLDQMNRSHASRLRLAPWFHAIAALNEDLVTAYADGSGTLPGDLPSVVTSSWDWRHRIAIPVHHIRRNSGESAIAAHAALVRIAYQQQSWVPFELPVPTGFGFDVSLFRTRGEISYGERLASLETLAWRNLPAAQQEAVCWERPILRDEFQYLSRHFRSIFLQNFILYERRWRSRFRYFVPYHNVEIERIAPPYRHGRYVALPEWWRFHEACRGCYVELPPALTYLGSFVIQGPRSGFWSVIVTEWAACTAAYILAEFYDQYRLWFIQPLVRAAIRNLDLSVPLGGISNNHKVLQLLRLIDSIDWREIPLKQSGRLDGGGGSTGGPGLGRNTALAGDFIYFDPWEFREISSEEARELCDELRHVPDDHPIGYVDSDDYYRAYSGDGPMVDDEPEEPGDMELDVADMVVDESPEAVPPVPSPPTASARPSLPSGGTVNESDIIVRFLRGAGLSAAEVSGDVTAMADALAYRLAGGHAPDDGEGSNL